MSAGPCKVVRDNHGVLESQPWGFCLEKLIREEFVDHPVITAEIGRIYDSDDPIEMKLAERLQDAICANQMSQRQQEFMRHWIMEFDA